MTGSLLPIVSAIPHRTYVEPFGGSASLLFAKHPSLIEIYNDLDGDLVNLFRVMRDQEQCTELHRLLTLTPYARAEYAECAATYQDATLSDVERARRYYTVMRQSFGGRFGSGWGFVVTASRGGMANTTSNWLGAIDGLQRAHERIQRVQIECRDWRQILATYDTPDTLFYVDPPYVMETRRDGGYAHEMTDADHAALVTALLSLKGAAVVSGYAHPIYDRLTDSGWQRHDFQTSSFAAGRTRHTGIQGEGAATRMQARTETVWVSRGADGHGDLFTHATDRGE